MSEMYRSQSFRTEQNRGPERREKPADMLKGMLRREAAKMNETIANEHGIEDLLMSDGSLDPAGYTELYGEEVLARDADTVHQRELDFSLAKNPRVAEFYRTKYKLRTETEIIAKWKENKGNEKNGQMEMAVTLLLSEMLGKEFLVVRTAPLDDYGGMDNLILDYATGEVVGAFDEVHEGGDGRDTANKQEKIHKIADRGGARVQYGLKLEDGRLARTRLENVPVFYLGLASSELAGLVDALRDTDKNKQVLQETFIKLLDSLALQQRGLSRVARSEKLLEKLETFRLMLERVRAQSVA